MARLCNLITFLMICGACHGQVLSGPIMVTIPAAGGAANPGVESNFQTNTLDATLTTMTFSFTTAGANRLLFVCTGVGESSPNLYALTGVTYNGVAFTKSWATNSTDWVGSDGWYLVNPASGANTLVVTFGGSGADQRWVNAINITNVHQTVPVDTAATASGTSTAPSVVVTSAANDLVISSVSTDAEGTLTMTVGTQIAKTQNVGTDTDYGSAQSAGAATVTHTWTTGLEDWAIGGVSINPP